MCVLQIKIYILVFMIVTWQCWVKDAGSLPACGRAWPHYWARRWADTADSWRRSGNLRSSPRPTPLCSSWRTRSWRTNSDSSVLLLLLGWSTQTGTVATTKPKTCLLFFPPRSITYLKHVDGTNNTLKNESPHRARCYRKTNQRYVKHTEHLNVFKSNYGCTKQDRAPPFLKRNNLRQTFTSGGKTSFLFFFLIFF